MNRILILAITLLLSLAAAAQDFLSKNEYFYTLDNRLQLLIDEDTAAKNISLGLVFQCGSLTERDAFHGLSFLYEHIISTRLRNALQQIIPEHRTDSTLLKVSSETTYEHVSFRLSVPKGRLESVLSAINEVVSSPFSDFELKEAAAFSTREYQSRMLDPAFSLDQHIGKVLWENDYKKRITLQTWTDSATQHIPGQMTKLRERYLCPGNGFLVIRGDVAQKATYETVQKAFRDWARCTINPFTRFPAPNYRLILNSRQLIDENPLTAAPFFRMAFPGPNTYEDRRSNYCALVMAAILASPGSRIHRMLSDSCRLASVTLHNDLAKFISQLTFQINPADSLAASGYECFRALVMAQRDSALSEEDLLLGKEAVISGYRASKADPAANISQIIKFWVSVTLNDYSTFEDSIRSVTVNDMMEMFDKYFRERHYVAALSIQPSLRQSLRIDTTFTPIPEGIKSYRIEFLKNTAQFSGAKDDTTLTSIIQFLKINPELVIKVNGICHKDELLKVTDGDMYDWIHSLQHFLINPPSLIKRKQFRLDVYRSLTIIKKLNEAGIDIKRLFGTGFLVKTPGETGPFQYAHFSEIIN